MKEKNVARGKRMLKVRTKEVLHLLLSRERKRRAEHTHARRMLKVRPFKLLVVFYLLYCNRDLLFYY